jgi:crotonobetainyl-CoA:carnitine CoA-transferase CaiB-like acyl-CoA transferase
MASDVSDEVPAGVLASVRVLDMGRFIAGPMCAAMLGDLGAEVIRVERIGGSDDRFQYLTGPKGDNGACFLQWNRNKRSLTLDPQAPGAGEILRRLILSADIVVANLPQEGLAQLGIDYESLKAIRADIILVHVSAFGARGPYADRVGLDGIGQAMSGIAYLSGFGDRPGKSFASWVDTSTAMLSAYGALAALMHRRATGQGQLVGTNLLRSALNVSSYMLTEQAQTGRNRVSSGNRSQSSGPADMVKTRDGWIIVQCVGQPLYRRWARLMGEETWLTDPRFSTDELRAVHGEILTERTSRWAATRTTAEALAELSAAKLPGGPILSPQQVLDDPHVREGGYIQEMDYPGLERAAPLVTPGVELSATPATIRTRAPTIGEHTDEILGELGFGADEIQGFRSRRIV